MAPTQSDCDCATATAALSTEGGRENKERFLAAIVQSSEDVIISKNLDGVITSWNKSAERVFGYSADEAIGRSIYSIVPAYLAEEERQILKRITEGEVIQHYETVRVTKRGELVDVSLTISPIRGAEEKVVGASTILRDITKRKQREKVVTEQARLLNLSFDAIMVCDCEDRITFWNRGCQELYGWSGTEVLGKVAHELLQAVLPEPFSAIEAKLKSAGRWQGEVIQRARDGRQLSVAARWVLQKDGKGNPFSILKSHNDITARKVAEQEVREAHRRLADRAADLERAVAERTAHLQRTIAELETVSYSLSHDMRAPLRSIHSFAEILIADAGERLTPSERHLLQRMISSAGRLDRLILDVLSYGRVATEEIAPRRVDLDRLLDQIITERPEFQPPDVEIELIRPLHSVCGHEAYLTQCITNLLDNAVKFVAKGVRPRVRIWAEERDGQIRLWFEDNGVGIAPEFKDRVFGMFQRLHDRSYPGTGIGLAIVRKAVERMGGKVGVESEPGKGSRFWLQLSKPGG
jgi:PAS domain S-box-containing protein